MKLFDIVSAVVTISALFSYLNYRFIKLPNTIGLMFITLVVSFVLLSLRIFGIDIDEHIVGFAKNIDFNKTLLEWMLCFLLFSGSINVNTKDLLEHKWTITIFSTLSLLISVLIIATSTYYLFSLFDIHVQYIYCLLFGTLVSPTDPIAVLGILKKAGAPKELEINIVGESLFNDGVSVVLFLVLLGVLSEGAENFTINTVLKLFMEEAVGGIIFGSFLGYLTYQLLKKIDNYQVEIMLTLALVTGGYSLSSLIHVSGPLAIVMAGLIIGNFGRTHGMSEHTVEHLDLFWELVDEILNTLLFTLIGLEVLVVKFEPRYIFLDLIIIFVALFARFVSIGIPVIALKSRKDIAKNATKIMTWGGLRGGLSVALALALPPSIEKDLILTMTYSIVVFSIIIQGLTIKYLVKPTQS